MAAAVSVTSAITGVDPGAMPFSTSRAVICRSSSSTSPRPRDLGSMIPPGRAGMIAARSSAVHSPSSGLIRTHNRARSSALLPARNSAIAARALVLPLSTTASSRSNRTMSASPSAALVIFFTLSPGANSQLRMRICGWGASVMRVLEAKPARCVKRKAPCRSVHAVVLARFRLSGMVRPPGERAIPTYWRTRGVWRGEQEVRHQPRHRDCVYTAHFPNIGYPASGPRQ